MLSLYVFSKIFGAKSLDWAKNTCIGALSATRLICRIFELVLTTRCTLRYESCNNLMQYFDSKNAYTCTFDDISAVLDRIFAVDSIGRVRIIGGLCFLKTLQKSSQSYPKSLKSNALMS